MQIAGLNFGIERLEQLENKIPCFWNLTGISAQVDKSFSCCCSRAVQFGIL